MIDVSDTIKIAQKLYTRAIIYENTTHKIPTPIQWISEKDKMIICWDTMSNMLRLHVSKKPFFIYMQFMYDNFR